MADTSGHEPPAGLAGPERDVPSSQPSQPAGSAAGLRLSALRLDDLLGEVTDPRTILPRIAARTRELAGADLTMIAVPDPLAPGQRLVVTAADGPDATTFHGLHTPIHGSVAGTVYRTGTARPVTDIAADADPEPLFATAASYGPALVVPLGGPVARGVLIAANLIGGAEFAAEEAAVTGAFAGQAALAIELAEAQQTRRQLAVYTDRDRIARDLHDHVIQRLFAVGMALESVNRQAAPALQTRLHRAVDDLDHTIREIRATIFELQTAPDEIDRGLPPAPPTPAAPA